MGLVIMDKMLAQGTKAFCSGGDQTVRKKDGYADQNGVRTLNVLDLQVLTLQSINDITVLALKFWKACIRIACSCDLRCIISILTVF